MSEKSLIATELSRAFERAQDRDNAPTKRSLARAIKVSEAQLGRFLTGEREPRASELIALARELRMNPAVFWARRGQNTSPDDGMLELVMTLSDLPEDRRREIIKLLLEMIRTFSNDQ